MFIASVHASHQCGNGTDTNCNLTRKIIRSMRDSDLLLNGYSYSKVQKAKNGTIRWDCSFCLTKAYYIPEKNKF